VQGAWYTLTPNWQCYWQETNAGVPNLPRRYDAARNWKVAIILTDGVDNWQLP